MTTEAFVQELADTPCSRFVDLTNPDEVKVDCRRVFFDSKHWCIPCRARKVMEERDGPVPLE